MMPETGNVNDYVVEPGGVLTYRGDQAPQQFKHASPDGNMLQSILSLMDKSIEGVTISQYAAGLPNSATDNTKGTATGILHLQEAAGDIVSFMRTNFQQSLTQIGRMWLSNNQQYMDKPVTMMIKTQGEKQQMTINPQDIQGDIELMVDDKSMDPANQDQRIAQYMSYVQQLEQMQQASFAQAAQTNQATTPLYIDFATLLQDFSELTGHTNYDKILLNAQEIQQKIAQSSDQQVGNERFSTDINQLYGTEAAQWLQKHGIQADPRRVQQTPQIDPAQVQLASLQVKADKNQADTALKAHKQVTETVNMMDQQQQQGGQQPQEPQQQSPNNDQQIAEMANQLVQTGHLSPDILAQLPGQQAAAPQQAGQGVSIDQLRAMENMQQ